MADAERTEDALHRLALRHTTAVIQMLDANDGPMRLAYLVAETGMDQAVAHAKLRRLQADGLVARSGSRHGDPYVLTDAAQALGPVYAGVEDWSEPGAVRRDPPSARRPEAAATRARAADMPLSGAGEDIRVTAALQRSTPTSTPLFSHPSQPQPRVSAAVTLQSTPGRGR